VGERKTISLLADPQVSFVCSSCRNSVKIKKSGWRDEATLYKDRRNLFCRLMPKWISQENKLIFFSHASRRAVETHSRLTLYLNCNFNLKRKNLT
jgi:hypothetical protein